jgi:hypothetical protein
MNAATEEIKKLVHRWTDCGKRASDTGFARESCVGADSARRPNRSESSV